jgi:hypothetical protein
MKAVCTSCRLEGRPGVIGERPPLNDPTEVTGICWSHKLQVLIDTKTISRTDGKPDELVRFIVIVRRSAPELFSRIRQQLLDDLRVHVVLDRRLGERRQRPDPTAGDRRRESRRNTPDYWQDIRYHPVVIAPAHKRLDVGARVATGHSVTITEAIAMETTSSFAENRHRIADWLRDSDVIITRAIPSLFQECDAQRHRAEAAEERAQRLAALVEELQSHVTTLQAELNDFTRLRAEMTESIEEWMTEVARLTNDVVTKIKPARPQHRE